VTRGVMTRGVRMKLTTAFLALILTGSPAVAQAVRIGVLGLFHPRELTLSPSSGTALVVHAGAESLVLERSSGMNVAHTRIAGDGVALDVGTRVLRAREITVTSRENGPAEFTLAVPGKITRRYRGKLELKPASRDLTAVVTMDLETAVASVVAAESAADAPTEGLKALSVAARSYLVAGRGRHHNFDFCDTTHCQFLREAPADNSAVGQAVLATRSLVIAYQSQPMAAMYSRSCSGRTRTPAQLGLPLASYPYYSVDCKYCRQHPSHWQSRISAEDAATLRRSNESSRLKLDRRLGWSAVPSNDFTLRKDGNQILLRGVGQGHGIGLCQAGAKGMAEEGASFREILAHYYPNTVVTILGSAALLH
jgi:stage II sporulation protein D